MDVRHTEDDRRDAARESEHKMSAHSHSLPVLLMFLKLPKLFSFHILRLAAEQEISSRKGSRETEKDKYKR